MNDNASASTKASRTPGKGHRSNLSSNAGGDSKDRDGSLSPSSSFSSATPVAPASGAAVTMVRSKGGADAEEARGDDSGWATDNEEDSDDDGADEHRDAAAAARKAVAAGGQLALQSPGKKRAGKGASSGKARKALLRQQQQQQQAAQQQPASSESSAPSLALSLLTRASSFAFPGTPVAGANMNDSSSSTTSPRASADTAVAAARDGSATGAVSESDAASDATLAHLWGVAATVVSVAGTVLVAAANAAATLVLAIMARVGNGRGRGRKRA